MNSDMKRLTGLARDHLAPVEGDLWLHRDLAAPFAGLREAAAREGIDLAVASGHRDFRRQLAIWNAKARGKRPVLSADGTVALDVAALAPEERVFAILRWSALPGTSRHHWGTDMDVWDAAAVEPGYRLQLTPAEYAADGPFARLGAWMAAGNLERHGFFRPYARDTGGVSPEPWHISYRPLAGALAAGFDLAALAELLAGVDLALKQPVLVNLERIVEQFVVLQADPVDAANGLT